MMLPPRPPSPPSGPPRGTNFSRRKEALPLPPLPAMTSIFASSKNFMRVLASSFGRHVRKRHADAQRDEGESREDVQPFPDRGLAAHPVADHRGEDRDRAEHHDRHGHEYHAKDHHLQRHVAGL